MEGSFIWNKIYVFLNIWFLVIIENIGDMEYFVNKILKFLFGFFLEDEKYFFF